MLLSLRLSVCSFDRGASCAHFGKLSRGTLGLHFATSGGRLGAILGESGGSLGLYFCWLVKADQKSDIMFD